MFFTGHVRELSHFENKNTSWTGRVGAGATRLISRLIAARTDHSTTKEKVEKGPVRTVMSKVSTGASQSVYQARPRTVAFSKQKARPGQDVLMRELLDALVVGCCDSVLCT